MNKQVIYIVTTNGILVKLREKKISSWDLIDEFQARYEDSFVGYETSYLKALEMYYNDFKLFGGENIVNNITQQIDDVNFLERCYKRNIEV